MNIKKKGGDTSIELYNLTNDIGEEHNVAAQHPEIVEKMKTMMLKARTESDQFPFSEI